MSQAYQTPSMRRLLASAVEFKADDAAGTLEGYGAFFGNIDRARDVIRPGAFKSSLAGWKKKGQMPGFFWRHNDDEPVGEWLEMSEDSKGLYVKGRLFIDAAHRTEASIKAWNLATSNGPKGFSIGFYPIKWKMDTNAEDGMPFRDLSKIELAEVSIAPFVINDKAEVLSAKADKPLSLLHDENGGAISIRAAEATVRDALGLSRAEAKALLSGGFAALAGLTKEAQHRRDAGGDDALAALVAHARACGLSASGKP